MCIRGDGGAEEGDVACGTATRSEWDAKAEGKARFLRDVALEVHIFAKSGKAF